MKKINWADEIISSSTKIIKNGIDELNNTEIRRDVLIHNSRKRVKNLRALLKLIQPELNNKKCKENNSILRNLNRESANIRRSYVMLGIIDTKIKLKSDEVSIKILDNLRHTVEQIMITSQPKININQILTHYSDRFHDLEKYFNDLHFTKKDFSLLINGFTSIYDKAKYFSKISAKNKDVVLYHELRKNVKDLSFVLEVIQKAWPDVIKSYNKQLKLLTDYVGEMHDFYEFTLLLNKTNLPVKMFKGKDTLKNNFEEKIAFLMVSSEDLSSKLFADKTKCFVSRFARIARYKISKPQFHNQ